MILKKYKKNLNILLIFIINSLISGCHDIVLMNPKGQIGLEEKSLIISALKLMLIIVIPTILMAFVFIAKYHALNKKAKYSPNWCHSNTIEIVVWTIPIFIIIVLANLTWNSTHELDPIKPINHYAKTMNIQVIAMDWKWLFIYPDQHIATVNKIVFPYNIPIKFQITSNSVMNSFFIPQLGSQIYAMPGMNATLNLIANQPGSYKGMSSNFSGRGFSGMKFIAIATPNQSEFNNWVCKVRSSSDTLDTIESYEKLARPSEYNSIQYFSKIKPNLYQYVINKFMENKNSNINIQNNHHSK